MQDLQRKYLEAISKLSPDKQEEVKAKYKMSAKYSIAIIRRTMIAQLLKAKVTDEKAITHPDFSIIFSWTDWVDKKTEDEVVGMYQGRLTQLTKTQSNLCNHVKELLLGSITGKVAQDRMQTLLRNIVGFAEAPNCDKWTKDAVTVFAFFVQFCMQEPYIKNMFTDQKVPKALNAVMALYVDTMNEEESFIKLYNSIIEAERYLQIQTGDLVDIDTIEPEIRILEREREEQEKLAQEQKPKLLAEK